MSLTSFNQNDPIAKELLENYGVPPHLLLLFSRKVLNRFVTIPDDLTTILPGPLLPAVLPPILPPVVPPPILPPGGGGPIGGDGDDESDIAVLPPVVPPPALPPVVPPPVLPPVVPPPVLPPGGGGSIGGDSDDDSYNAGVVDTDDEEDDIESVTNVTDDSVGTPKKRRRGIDGAPNTPLYFRSSIDHYMVAPCTPRKGKKTNLTAFSNGKAQRRSKRLRLK